MSNELVSVGEPGGWREIAAHEAGKDNPLRLVPHEIRGPLSVLWMANFHLFPSALALCATVRVYTSEHELPADVMTAIVKRLMHPDQRAKIKFASDLIAELSRLVADAIRSRKAAAETRERREMFAADGVSGPLASSLAGDLFLDPERGT